MAQNLPATHERTDVSGILNQEAVKKRFEQVLGKKAAGFMSSVISAVSSNNELKKAAPMTVIAAAAVAASLDLPINPSLGFAHIVPYKKDGLPIAQFQMGWRGFVQLGMRSGQYKTINTCAVYEGELIESNRFTGEMYFDESRKTSDKVIGYVAYFKLMNGYEKYLYMTVEQIQSHGQRYSKSYNNAKSKWQTDFEAMALKTPLKLLLSRWGILSIEMQTAVQLDHATVKNIDGTAYDYDDNPEGGSIIDAATETERTPEQIAGEFSATIPAGTDMDVLHEFIEATAKRNNAKIEEVEAEAVQKPAAFWKIFNAYAKSRKQQNDNKAAPQTAAPEYAPRECPEHHGDTYLKDHCDKCGKRQGCPAWE